MDVNKTARSPWCRPNVFAVPRMAILGVAFLAPIVVPFVGHATMPSVPMSVTLESAGNVAVDADLTVTLTARPLVDAEQLSMTITLPEGVELVAGDVTWTGPLRAHESRALTVTVRPRRAANVVIRGQVRLDFPDGTTLGETRSVTLELGDRAKQSLGVAPQTKTGAGESIIEFRATP